MHAGLKHSSAEAYRCDIVKIDIVLKRTIAAIMLRRILWSAAITLWS